MQLQEMSKEELSKIDPKVVQNIDKVLNSPEAERTPHFLEILGLSDDAFGLTQYCNMLQEKINITEDNLSKIGIPSDPENPLYNVSGSTAAKYAGMESFVEAISESSGDILERGLSRTIVKPIKKTAFISSVGGTSIGKYVGSFFTAAEDFSNKIPGIRGSIQSMPIEQLEEIEVNFVRNPWGTKEEYKQKRDQLSDANFYIQTLGTTGVMNLFGSIANNITGNPSEAAIQSTIGERINYLADAFANGKISVEAFNNEIFGVIDRDKKPLSLPSLLLDLEKMMENNNDEKTLQRLQNAKNLLKQIGFISALDKASQSGDVSTILDKIKIGLINEAKSQGINPEDYIGDDLFYKNLFKYAEELEKLKNHPFVNEEHKDTVEGILYNMILNNTINESLANPIKDLLQQRIDSNVELDENSRDATKALNELLGTANSEAFDQIANKYGLSEDEKLDIQAFKKYNNFLQRLNAKDQEVFASQTATDEESLNSLKKEYNVQDSERASQDRLEATLINEEGKTIIDAKKAEIQEKTKSTPDIATQIDTLTSNLGSNEYIQYNGGYYRKLDNGEVVKSGKEDIPEDSFVKNYKEKDGVLINADLDDAVKNDKDLKAESESQKNNFINENEEVVEELTAEERWALGLDDFLDVLPAPMEETSLSDYEKNELKRKFLPLIKRLHLSPEEVLNGKYFVLSQQEIQFLKEEIQKDENDIDKITREKWGVLDDNRINELVTDNKKKILGDYVEKRVQLKQEEKVNSQLQDKHIQQKAQSVKDSNILKVAISKIKGTITGLKGKSLTITIADDWVKHTIRDENEKEVNIVDFLRKNGVPVEKIVGLPINEIREKLSDKQFRLFISVVPLQGTYSGQTIIGIVPASFNNRYNPLISLIRDVQDMLREDNWVDTDIEKALQEFKDAVLAREPKDVVLNKLHTLDKICQDKGKPITNLIKGHQQVSDTAMNLINKTRGEIAKYGKSKLTVKDIKKGIPEVNENNVPVLFSNIEGNESFRFIVKKTNKNNQEKEIFSLVDVETGKPIVLQQVQNYELVKRQLFAKPFILIKTGNTVNVKVIKDGKEEIKKKSEYTAVFIDDTRVPKSNDLVSSFLDNYEFLSALCHHDFSLGNFVYTYKGSQIEITKENCDSILTNIYDTLGFSNNVNDRNTDELLSYLNRVYTTLIDDSYRSNENIRINFLELGNEKVIVPLFNIGVSNGQVVVSNKTDNPLTVGDFRKNTLSTKSKVENGKVTLEDFIELTDSEPIQRQTAPTQKTEDVVEESNQDTNTTVVEQKEEKPVESQEKQQEDIKEDFTLEEDETEVGITTTEEQVNSAKNIVNSTKADSDNLYRINNLIKNIVFRKFAFRRNVKITDVYVEVQRTLRSLIDNLPEGSSERIFLEKNYDKILALKDSNNYSGSVRKLIDDFFKISKSLTDDYLADSLELDVEADGYNVEVVYGKQSFEKDVTLDITTQLKMFLSGILKSNNESEVPEFYSEGDVYSVVQEAMNASKDHTIESVIQYLKDKVANSKSNLKIKSENGQIRDAKQNLDIFKDVAERLQELIPSEDDEKADIKNKLKRELEYNFYNNKVEMSFIYCYQKVVTNYDPYDPYDPYKTTKVKETMVLDANRRNAVTRRENSVKNGTRKLLKYDGNLKKYVYDKEKLRRLKELIERFQTTYQESGDYVVKDGAVKESAFNDLKEIFDILGFDLDESTVLDMFNYDTKSDVNPLEINSKKEHGYVIKYLTNLIENTDKNKGQIAVILNNNDVIYTIDYVGDDECVWTPYNTKTKKYEKSFTKPILAYNGLRSSGKATVRRILNEDVKYTFNPVPGIYVGEKRVNSFENIRYIGKQMSLIVEGLKSLNSRENKNDRAQTLIDNLKRSSFSRFSFLINLAEKSSEVLNSIGLEWSSLEAFVIKGKTNNKKDKSSITQLSEKDQIVSLLAYFVGGMYGKPVYEENGFNYYVTQFGFPALSDAQVLPLLKTGAILFTKEQLEASSEDSKAKIFVDEKVRELLFDTLVKGELMRIIEHIHYGKLSNVNGIDNGSLIFTLLPSLNALKVDDVSIIDKIKGLCIDGKSKDAIYKEIYKVFGSKIHEGIYKTIHEETGRLFRNLKDSGIIETEKVEGIDTVKKISGNISNTFLSKLKGNDTKKISQLCMNYVINSMIAQSDIYKLFAGDLACYNTDKMPSYFFGKNISTLDYDQLIDYYIDKTYTGSTATLYKNALRDPKVFERLNDTQKEAIKTLRQYNNPNSEIHERITRIAYSDFVENSLQNNLSKRLKMLISNGKILSGTMQSDVYTEAYQIMLEDVNSVSKSIEFYYGVFYKDTDKLTESEKKDVEDNMQRLLYLEKKKTLGPNQKVEYKAIKKKLMDMLPEIADYFDIADTDGQEYSTWKNHLQQLLLQGRLSENEYNRIYSKLESQSKLNRITKGNRLTPAELQLALMQPTKPVHVGMYFDQVGDEVNGYLQQKMVYIKTSSFPLIPQLTKGFEMDKLRKVMEKLENTDDGRRTVRVSYNSGNKVGGLKTAITFDQTTELHSKDKDFIKTALQSTYTILDLSNYSIQQDKPFDTFENMEKGKEDRITRGTQMEKSILSDGISKIEDKIFNADEFSLETLKDCGFVPENATRESIKGLKISGVDLKKIYDYLYEKEQNLLKKNLFDRFGITNYEQLNEPHVKEKIKNILDQRLDNDQDLDGIKLLHKFDVIENGELKHYELSQEEFNDLPSDTKSKIKNHTYDFNIAVWTLPNFRKFESVLNSVVSNNSIKLQLPGGHGIVASQKGFEIVSQDNYNGSVILTDGFNGELTAEYDDETGRLKSAQVFIANKFRKFNPDTNSFEFIDLEKYVIEKDGRKYLDTDRVPESVRTMFSYRIPTSSHQSGMRIEIVGFLPTECGDLVIVPKDSTKQMGEDFDIDVRYYYQQHIMEVPELTKDENTGEIVRSTRLQLLEPIDPEKNYSKEIRENYFDFLKTVVETKIKGGYLIDPNDPVYNDYGINMLMRWAIILSGGFFGENRNYKKSYLDDLKENFGATDATIKNINRLIALIKENGKLNDIQKYVNQVKYEEMELKSVENDLISIYKSVYSADEKTVQRKITAILSTDFLNDTANAIQGTKTEVSFGYYTPLSMISQLEIMKKGNAGKVGIGVWSSLEVFIALIQQCKNPIKFNKSMTIGKFNWDGTIGGYYDETTQSYQCLTPEDAPKGFEPRTIFRNIMEHQNSATDNQKLQIMEKLNENEYTFGAYEMLILMGIDKDGFTVKNSNGNDIELSYSALFMTQPIIKDYVEKCAYYNSLSTDTWFNIKDRIKEELLNKYKSDTPAQSSELTSENLYGNLSSVNNNIQVAVLNTFFELEEMFDVVRPYATKLNLEQRGLGKSFLDTIDRKDFLLEIMGGRDTDAVTGLDQLIGDFKVVGEDVVIDDVLEDEETQEPEPKGNQQQSNLPGPETQIAARGKMTFDYGNSKRSDVKSSSTLEAIKNGERTATTRYESDGHIDYWKKLKVGDIVEFEGKNGEKVLVRITKPLTKLSESTNAEDWSKKEGWSVDYFNSKVKSRINEAWQIEYELVSNQQAPQQQLKVTESKGRYAQRTKENADWSDITIAFATDFTTAGEKATKKYSVDKYMPVDIISDGSVDLTMLDDVIDKAKKIGKPIKLNIAGNGIYTLAKSGITQEKANNEIQFAIKYMLNCGVQIEEIRSGGQTGIDEAGIVAALRLGIPASIHAPIGFMFRGTDGKDVTGKQAFMARFSNNLSNVQQQLRITPQVKQLRNHSKHITFDESTHTYYIDGVPADISVTQLFNIEAQEPLNREHLTPMQVGAEIGSRVDKVGRDFFAGNLQENYKEAYGLSEKNVKQIVSQLEKVKEKLQKKYGEKCQFITDDNLLRLAAKLHYTDENGNPVDKVVAGTMDLLIIDEQGNQHVFDFKVKKVDNNGNVDLGKNTAYRYKNQGESYAKIQQQNVGNEVSVTFESDIVLSCVYPSANNRTYSLDDNGELLISDGTKTIPISESDEFDLGKDYFFPNLKDTLIDNDKISAFIKYDFTKKVVKSASDESQEELEQNGYVFFANDRYGRKVFIKPNGFYAHKIVNSISEGYNLWKNIFPYDESSIRDILEKVLSNADVVPGSETALEIEYEVIESLQDFIYSSLQCFRVNGNTLNDTRRMMFFDTPDNESFSHYVQRVVENSPTYKEMIFFKNLDYSIDLTGENPSVIIYNVNAERAGEKSQIYSMFKDFAESGKLLPAWNGVQMSEGLFARFLIQYAFLSNQNGATSFRKLVPIDTFNKIISITNSGRIINMKDNINIITSPSTVNFLLSPGVSYLSNIMGSSVNNDMIENKNNLSVITISALVNKYNTMYGKQIFSVDATGNVFINTDYGYRNNFVEQYFQHHPERVHKGSSKRFKQYKAANNGDIPQIIPIGENESFYYKRNYVTFRDGGNTILYKVNPITGNLVRMNLLGNQYFQEYSSTSTGNYSLIDSNNFTQTQKDENTTVKQQRVRYKSSIDILNSVLSDPENKYYGLAQYVKDVFTDKANAKVVYENIGDKASVCSYIPSTHTIVINTNYVIDKEVLQGKLLHEILHSLTETTLANFINTKEDKGVTFEKRDDRKYYASIKVKEDAPTAIVDLVRVYKDAVLALQDDSPIGKIFSSYLEVYADMLNSGKTEFNTTKMKAKIIEVIKTKYPQDSAELEALLNQENLFGLYYMSNPFEFVAGIFFNKPLMDKLNTMSVEDTSKPSFAERFARALTKLLDYIKSKLGIDVKSGFALDSVINSITDIIRQVDENFISIDENGDVTEQIFIDEYLEKVKREYQLFREDVKTHIDFFNAPIFTEENISLGEKMTIDGKHYRLLNISGIDSFDYAVSKENGIYKLSTVQFDETVSETIFSHQDFATLLHDFSKICDTFAKRGDDGFFNSPYFFELNSDQDFYQKSINKTYC